VVKWEIKELKRIKGFKRIKAFKRIKGINCHGPL
jgi:hypothetical protein